MDTVHDSVSRPVEVFVVEEIDPMRAVVLARGGVEMEGGHIAVEPAPRENVADSFIVGVEVEASEAPPITVSTITDFVTGQGYGELPVPVLPYAVVNSPAAEAGPANAKIDEAHARNTPARPIVRAPLLYCIIGDLSCR